MGKSELQHWSSLRSGEERHISDLLPRAKNLTRQSRDHMAMQDAHHTGP